MDFGKGASGCGLAFFRVKYQGTQHALGLMSQQTYGNRHPPRELKNSLLVSLSSFTQQRAGGHLAF